MSDTCDRHGIQLLIIRIWKSCQLSLYRFCQPCKVRKKLLLEQLNSHSNISDDGGEENLCGLLALGSWVRCGALAHCVTISLFTPTLIMMMTINMVTMVMVMLHINMLPIFSQCSPPTIASSKMFIFFLSMLSSNIYWFQVGKFVERMVNGAEQDFDFYHSAQSGETFPSSNNVLSSSISQLLIFIYIWKLPDSNSFQILIRYFTVAKVFEQNGLFSKWIAEKDIFCHKLEGLGY